MVEPKLARAYGTLAGFGFIGVALLALPSTRLLDPTPAPEAYLLTLAGLVTGLICLAIPWDWVDPRWLHLVGALATVEAAATVAVFGLPYVAFYFMIAVLVAYVAPDPRTIALQLGIVLVALFGPVVYGPEDARTSLAVALVVAPVLVLTTGLFSYLRLKMVHDRRAYHRFAEQTLVLSSRIAGRPLGPIGLVPELESVPRFAWVRPPTRWVAAASALLGVPLLAGSLAVAGVKLPPLAADPFERVGIELPNQEADAASPAAVRSATRPDRSSEPTASVSRKQGGGDSGEPRSAGEEAPAQGGATSAGPAATPNTQAAQEPDSVQGSPESPAPESPGVGDGAPQHSPLGDLLGDATDGLRGLFGSLKLEERQPAESAPTPAQP